ncbi:ankyrin repeat and SOCS box protein 6 isoform X3 [Odocoileus virginianus]|uniref:Ankyrin repeat and SOCS box protein 6 isoform X3 n=1 Tax=Odocoileus virginianus TaxID=9874 RepID=A0ABM4H4Q1_ODOVR
MPFLHGFRRIIFEYQPLVDAILDSLGIQDPERQEPLDGPSYAASEESRILVLTELLERKAHSPFYQEGVSNALLKMAELGLARAAAVLLRNGANLNFEDPVTYYTALHIAVLRNQPDMVELLVRHGADVNRRDRIHESSPLDLASEEPERLPCLQRLLDLGADVNAADKHGWVSGSISGSRKILLLLALLVLCLCQWRENGQKPVTLSCSWEVRQPCSMLWPAVTGCRSTTPRTSGSCWKEGRTSRPLPKTGTQCSPASSSCWARQWEATKRRPS